MGEESSQIRDFCKLRNIQWLYHFTDIDNLISILEVGLCTPSSCKLRSLNPKVNDTERLDGQDAICLSIEWPNHQLFANYRSQGKTRPWAVLKLPSEVLWQTRCCFCPMNAAHQKMRDQSFEYRSGVKGLARLFRGDRGDLGDNYPTNPQAEVLCIDDIDPDLIAEVHITDRVAFAMYAELPNISNTTVFCYPRSVKAPRTAQKLGAEVDSSNESDEEDKSSSDDEADGSSDEGDGDCTEEEARAEIV